ncbi:hypothetical protein BD408DRAFT_408327 [Parasitella parasitica]|nr:hypothetical protein BD408DRAFT_408327 [Parasitella parasitica]
MASKLLFLIMFISMTLLGDRMVQGAPATITEDPCVQKAFETYDYRTTKGCTENADSTGSCKSFFEFSIKSLNTELAKCGNPKSFSLCRVKDPGSFSLDSCTAATELQRVTKEKCEAASKEPFTFYGQNGYKNTYSASEAFCINSPNVDCLSLCS